MRRIIDGHSHRSMHSLQVTIYFDKEIADLNTIKCLPEGCTIADLKKALAEDDPTGSSAAEDLILAKWTGELGCAPRPLGDAVLISEAGAELLICSPDDVIQAPDDKVEGSIEETRLNDEYEAQIKHLKALGVTDLPPPPEPDADGLQGSGAVDTGATDMLDRILGEQGAEAVEEPASHVEVQQPSVHQRWEVVGGADRGGIVVREGQDLASAQLSRLATGALVEELQLVGERLQYSKVSGEGPDSGWVSTFLKGKQLLVPVSNGSERGARLGIHIAYPDLDGQAVGPWQAHSDQVTTVLLDRFSTPPSKSRRLYSACWMESKMCSWDISKRSRGRPPYLDGDLELRGLPSDVAAISENCLLTSVSSQPLPEGGSVCHQADFKKRLAEQDDELGPGDSLLAWDLRLQPFQKPSASSTSDLATPLPKKIPLHMRGCNALSIWPIPSDDARGSDMAPQLVASISNDVLGVSRVAEDGIGFEGPALWKTASPHADDSDVWGAARYVCWSRADSLWSSSKTGKSLKAWDVSRGDTQPVCTADLFVDSLAALAMQPTAGLLIAAHDSGIVYFDTRACAVMKQQYTKHPVTSLRVLPEDSSLLFAGVGGNLVQYDIRMLAGRQADSKTKAVGTWDLPSDILSLDCLRSSKGSILVAVGCKAGHVAAFDTS